MNLNKIPSARFGARRMVGAGLVALLGAAAYRQHRKVRRIPRHLRAPLMYMPPLVVNEKSVRRLRAMTTRFSPPTPLPPTIQSKVLAIPGWQGQPDVKIVTFERIDRPADSPAMVWIHGGGYVIGSAESMAVDCVRFAQELNILVVSVDYRLAPEHPFPAPLDDCYAALTWVHDSAEILGIDRDRIAIGGESAGGGLCAALAQRALDTGRIKPVFQVLTYPMLDDRTALKTDHEGRGEVVWTNRSNHFGWTAYLGHQPAEGEDRPYAAPARRTDLAGLPPAWIGVGTLDLFYEEDLRYAERLQAAGVPCELIVIEGAYHGFQLMTATAPETITFENSKLEALRRGLGLAEVEHIPAL